MVFTLYAVKSGSVKLNMNLDDGVTVASIISNVSSSLKLLFFSSSSMHSDSMIAFKLPSLRIFVNDTLFCVNEKQSKSSYHQAFRTCFVPTACVYLLLNHGSFVVIASIPQSRPTLLWCVPFSAHMGSHWCRWLNHSAQMNCYCWVEIHLVCYCCARDVIRCYWCRCWWLRGNVPMLVKISKEKNNINNGHIH